MSELSPLAKVKAIVYDCDGVLTDNKVIVDEFGHEWATFNRGDGFAISKLFEMGIRQLVISTETNPIVLKRCQKLKLPVFNNVHNKLSILQEYLKGEGLDKDCVLYVGNDINDFECMSAVGIRGCPRDAEPEVKKMCEWVSSKNGGAGVVRELYRDICKVKGISCQ